MSIDLSQRKRILNIIWIIYIIFDCYSSFNYGNIENLSLCWPGLALVSLSRITHSPQVSHP